MIFCQSIFQGIVCLRMCEEYCPSVVDSIFLVNCSIRELSHSIQLQHIQVYFVPELPEKKLPARWGYTTFFQHCLHFLRRTITCNMDRKRITIHRMACQITRSNTTWFFSCGGLLRTRSTRSHHRCFIMHEVKNTVFTFCNNGFHIQGVKKLRLKRFRDDRAGKNKHVSYLTKLWLMLMHRFTARWS